MVRGARNMTSVFGHPAGTAPRHGRIWYWSRRRFDRVRSRVGGLAMVAAFALGALSFGFAGKMAGPFFEAGAPGFAPAPAAAAPTASKSAARNPLTPQGPSAASAPAVAPATDGSGSASVKVPAARPDRVESANTQATNTQAAPPAGDLAGAPRRTDANATETDGRETP